MSNRIRGVKNPHLAEQHNYLKKLVEIFDERSGRPITPGAISDCFVNHDNWCRALKGDACNCSPHIVFKSRK
jgi:hypothetical protein